MVIWLTELVSEMKVKNVYVLIAETLIKMMC